MSKPRTAAATPGLARHGRGDMKDNVGKPAKVGAVDVEAFAKNLARMVEEGGKALAAYMRPREEGQIQAGLSDEVTDMVKTLRRGREYWLADPSRAVELQSRLGKAYLELWGSAVKRLAGETVRAGGQARSEGPALRRSGMVDEPVLRFRQAGLSARARNGPTSWSRTPTASIRTPGRRPSSTSGRSPMRCRRRISS